MPVYTDCRRGTYGPIQRLQPELLRIIFLENTLVWDHHPLNTARSSSQVCRQWREILLFSSAVWGRIIDTEKLRFEEVNNPWRNEVLARSGSASLWIHGVIEPAYHDVFLSLLEQNWGRIEMVNVIDYHNIPFFSNSRIASWRMMESRASRLKVFNITYVCYGPPEPVEHSTTPLFRGGAPVLQCVSAVAIKFDACSSWLNNISEISLSSVFSVQEMFQILQAIPLLTRLSISQQSFQGLVQPMLSSRDLPMIDLPLLRSMVLRAYLSLALPFLERLNVPVSCIPDIVVSDVNEWEWDSDELVIVKKEHETINGVQDRYIKLLQKSLGDRRSIINARVVLQENYFEVSGDDGINCLDFKLGGSMLDGPTILDRVSFCDYLPRVQKITLDIPHPQASMFPAQFPACSKSVTTLATGMDTLQFFLNAKTITPGCIPFPSLEVLVLSTPDPVFPSEQNRDPLQGILDFLQWQIEGNSPVRVLYLTHIPIEQLHDMEYLDTVPGLQAVKWKPAMRRKKALQYECGSGRPKVLRFKHNLLSLSQQREPRVSRNRIRI